MKIKLALQISKAKHSREVLTKLKQSDENDKDETEQEQRDDRPQAEETEVEDAASTQPKPVHIIYQGRATTIPMPAHGIVTKDDIMNNQEPLSYEGTPEARVRREQTQYTPESFGACQTFVQSRATLIRKGHLTILLKHNEMIKRLIRLFSGKDAGYHPCRCESLLL